MKTLFITFKSMQETKIVITNDMAGVELKEVGGGERDVCQFFIVENDQTQRFDKYLPVISVTVDDECSVDKFEKIAFSHILKKLVTLLNSCVVTNVLETTPENMLVLKAFTMLYTTFVEELEESDKEDNQ